MGIVCSVAYEVRKVRSPNYNSTFQVFIKGTAGMRLLDEIQQEHIWTSLYEGLPVYETMGKKAIPFPIVQENLGVISGHSEAFYAVLSSNYIEGSIDSNLKYAIMYAKQLYFLCLKKKWSLLAVLSLERLWWERWIWAEAPLS